MNGYNTEKETLGKQKKKIYAYMELCDICMCLYADFIYVEWLETQKAFSREEADG